MSGETGTTNKSKPSKKGVEAKKKKKKKKIKDLLVIQLSSIVFTMTIYVQAVFSRAKVITNEEH